MILKAFTAILLTATSLSSLASPVFNADNGHYYELHTFTDDWRLDWVDAKNFAESLTFLGGSGYLATVTSQNEDDFLWNTLGAQGSFLGGIDTSGNETNWQWVTGEAFSYTNWVTGEPNNWQDNSPLTPNNEDYLMYWWPGNNYTGHWNDTNVDSSFMDNNQLKYTTRGFVVEYTPTATSPIVPIPHSIWLFASGILLMLKRQKNNA
ncbi:hypothetical protein A1359_04640 [Methylomonas lenta]|uniref:C-type lectin domain-containing protein n=1 Tax=Methylomonas lenta TaxID=980561 RepID=A0A177NKR3_9GAMM|nr:lectin-like protein [Methylomonas lenta]OAI18648.1 hypothetical protein A1359_04640 [Methylomonas lenta]